VPRVRDLVHGSVYDQRLVFDVLGISRLCISEILLDDAVKIVLAPARMIGQGCERLKRSGCLSRFSAFDVSMRALH
jgi:hypothetical protein